MLTSRVVDRGFVPRSNQACSPRGWQIVGSCSDQTKHAHLEGGRSWVRAPIKPSMLTSRVVDRGFVPRSNQACSPRGWQIVGSCPDQTKHAHLEGGRSWVRAPIKPSMLTSRVVDRGFVPRSNQACSPRGWQIVGSCTDQTKHAHFEGGRSWVRAPIKPSMLTSRMLDRGFVPRSNQACSPRGWQIVGSCPDQTKHAHLEGGRSWVRAPIKPSMLTSRVVDRGFVPRSNQACSLRGWQIVGSCPDQTKHAHLEGGRSWVRAPIKPSMLTSRVVDRGFVPRSNQACSPRGWQIVGSCPDQTKHAHFEGGRSWVRAPIKPSMLTSRVVDREFVPRSHQACSPRGWQIVGSCPDHPKHAHLEGGRSWVRALIKPSMLTSRVVDREFVPRSHQACSPRGWQIVGSCPDHTKHAHLEGGRSWVRALIKPSMLTSRVVDRGFVPRSNQACSPRGWQIVGSCPDQTKHAHFEGGRSWVRAPIKPSMLTSRVVDREFVPRSHQACSPRGWQIVGSCPDQTKHAHLEGGRSWVRALIKPKTIQLVIAASTLSTEH